MNQTLFEQIKDYNQITTQDTDNGRMIVFVNARGDATEIASLKKDATTYQASSNELGSFLKEIVETYDIQGEFLFLKARMDSKLINGVRDFVTQEMSDVKEQIFSINSKKAEESLREEVKTLQHDLAKLKANPVLQALKMDETVREIVSREKLVSELSKGLDLALKYKDMMRKWKGHKAFMDALEDEAFKSLATNNVPLIAHAPTKEFVGFGDRVLKSEDEIIDSIFGLEYSSTRELLNDTTQA